MTVLFRSVSDSREIWLFVILPDKRWSITRDGETIAVGGSDPKSVEAGVRKYLSLSTAPLVQLQSTPINVTKS